MASMVPWRRSTKLMQLGRKDEEEKAEALAAGKVIPELSLSTWLKVRERLTSELLSAMDTLDEKLIICARTRAKNAGVAEDVLHTAWAKVRHLRARAAVVARLALRGRFADLPDACLRAKCAGLVRAEVLSLARRPTEQMRIRRAWQATSPAINWSERGKAWEADSDDSRQRVLLSVLQNALKDGSKPQLQLACNRSSLAGADERIVLALQKRLRQVCAWETLVAKMRAKVLHVFMGLELAAAGNSVWQCDQAIKSADLLAIPARAFADVQAARWRQLFAIPRRAVANVRATRWRLCALEAMSAADGLPGKLMRLLGLVLAQDEVREALLDWPHELARDAFVAERSRAFNATNEAPGAHLQGGRPCYMPNGWLRCGLATRSPGKHDAWCVGYHGTSIKSLVPILFQGLRRPGRGGVAVAHGQKYSTTRRSIFLSPSLEYAAFPVYAQFFKFDHAEDHWGQLALECAVRPESFLERPGTLKGSKYWPEDLRFDPDYPSLDGLEWLLDNPDDVVVTGLMLREFGPQADREVYGDAAHKVSKGKRGPEFEWTSLRMEEFSSKGLLRA